MHANPGYQYPISQLLGVPTIESFLRGLYYSFVVPAPFWFLVTRTLQGYSLLHRVALVPGRFSRACLLCPHYRIYLRSSTIYPIVSIPTSINSENNIEIIQFIISKVKNMNMSGLTVYEKIQNKNAPPFGGQFYLS